MMEQIYDVDMPEQWSESDRRLLTESRHQSLNELEGMFEDKTRMQIRNKLRYMGYSYRLIQANSQAHRNLELSETDKAYMAAMIDGEGTVRIAFDPRYGKSYSPRVSISNNNLDLLEWFKEKIGAGHIAGLEYYCNNYETKALLEALRPYLKIKDKHADLAIEFINLRLSRKKWCDPYTSRELAIYNEMTNLNRKPQLSKREPTENEIKDYLEKNKMKLVEKPAGE